MAKRETPFLAPDLAVAAANGLLARGKAPKGVFATVRDDELISLCFTEKPGTSKFTYADTFTTLNTNASLWRMSDFYQGRRYFIGLA